jgi:cation:H+ antiporter
MSGDDAADASEAGGTASSAPVKGIENAPEPHTARGILSLFLWNQVLVIASLFLAMLGVQTITAEQTSLGGMAVSLFLLLLAIGLLITSADFFVEGAKGLARQIGIAEVIIGLTIVSLGTSLPEILISAQASWEAYQNPCMPGVTDCATDFALGNIFGSVLVQITLILGLVVVVRPLSIRPAWIQRDGLMMFLAVMLLSMLILVDGDLNRLEGALLCLLYVMYITYLIQHRDEIRSEEFEVLEDIRAETGGHITWTSAAYFAMLMIGLGLAMFASARVIDSAAGIAIEMGVPSAAVGSTLSAIGTSFPELAVALLAARRSTGIAVGTLIGSNITDPMLSVGIAAIINPIVVSDTTLFYGLIIPATLFCTGLALVFMWTDFKFNRPEGVILIGCYAVFLFLLYGSI